MPDEKLIITTKRLSEDVMFTALKGSIDSDTYGELEQTIDYFFNQYQYKIVIDMSGVDYINSIGVSILVGALTKAQENNGNIVLISPKPEVREVFNLLGNMRKFTIINNMESALKVFTQ